MPHFTLTMTPAGPLVDAFVGVSLRSRQALEAARQPVPPPSMIKALLDTGASETCVDPTVIASLGLTAIGSVWIHTPSTGSMPHQTARYEVALMIPAANGQPLVRPTLAAIESQLLQQYGFHALIGRDVLTGCVLTYNGTAGFFILAY